MSAARTAGRSPTIAEAWRGQKPNHDVVDADSGEVIFKAHEKITPRKANAAAKDGLKNLIIPTEEIFGRFSAYDLINEKTGEIYVEAGDEISAENLEIARQGRRRPARAARHRLCQHRSLDPQHAEGRQVGRRRQRAGRHLSRHAPRRAADPRDRGRAVLRPVLRSRALRPLGRRPGQAQHAPWPRRRGHRHHAAPRGHPRGRPGAGEPQGRQGRDRRHRQSRQPPRPLGRRAAREPVSRRPAAHGARGEGADELGRRVDGHAERPDQRQAGGRRGARILRLVAAVAVHGPDQPAVGSHPQAPRFGARAGRPDPRARRLRSPRRPPDPLWPHLPDRDPGRPEHRPDQLARQLQPGQQVRLHRDAVPQGRRATR